MIEQLSMANHFGLSLTSLLRGLLGIVSLLIIAVLFSRNRKRIDWKLVGIGLIVQLALAVSVLFLPPVQMAFDFVGKIFVKIMGFTASGASFLFGSIMDTSSFGYIFAFNVLPTIIFFSALTSLLYYLNVIQKVVQAVSWMLRKALNITGAEGLTVAGNIFLGQTESPLLIKGYLAKMTVSEIFLVMTAGMATIAGGVMASYIGMLGGGDPATQLAFAKHLLSASVMAAPGAVVFAKILMPQTDPVVDQVAVEKNQVGTNILDAIANGTTDGLKLAVNVAGMLLVFIAFVAFANYLISKFIGSYAVSDVVLGLALLAGLVTGILYWYKHKGGKKMRLAFWVSTGLVVVGLINVFATRLGSDFVLNQFLSDVSGGRYTELNFQFIVGLLFSPVVLLMGISPDDAIMAGQLLGEKTIMNEFVAYESLNRLMRAGMFADPKTIVMSTYMLCGFANISSIGIQIGGIGSLAPSTRPWLTKYGPYVVLAGTLVSCMSATIVGMFIG
ncbi:MAG: Na+ dependent nucleoside transporter [Bacteroidales bacterium]|nr:Na+ dependent nucleoside transporter [Bacteroidales bacterium]